MTECRYERTIAKRKVFFGNNFTLVVEQATPRQTDEAVPKKTVDFCRSAFVSSARDLIKLRFYARAYRFVAARRKKMSFRGLSALFYLRGADNLQNVEQLLPAHLYARSSVS